MECELEMTKEKGCMSTSPGPAAMSEPSRGFLMAQVGLRILAIGFISAAITTTVISHQTVSVFGIQMQARYTYSSAFRFKLGADAVACAFLLLSLMLVKALSQTKSNLNYYFYLFLHDMVMMVLMISGCAAASAIGYVGRYGQNQTGWMAICDHVTKFCDKLLLSILSSYVAFACLFLLTIMAAYKLKLDRHTSQEI